MYHREHPPAHFHARYGGRKVTVRIKDGYFEGELPPRVRTLVLEWWCLHREELTLRVNPDTGTIEWPNAAGFAPEFLYQRVRLTA